jgi:predicted phosphodiesterase
MPDLQPDRPFVVSIHCSDFHLWDVPPSYRENEPDWWAAMLRPIEQIKALQRKYHGVPIVFGGDLFDRWKPSPELINFALKHLPVMYGIAGNHDLPNHRLADIERSGYWTMVEAGRVIDLKYGSPHPLNIAVLHGFPFGTEIKSITNHALDGFNVAVVHAYIWKKNHGYMGASEDKRVGEWERKLGGFSHAFFGDNHNAFDYQGRDTWVVNTGCIMRRRRDESTYTPSVWLLWSDGEVSRKKLDCSEDVYTMVGDVEGGKRVVCRTLDPSDLIKSLKGLQQKNRIDFQATVTELMTTLGVSEEVRSKVMEAMEAER